MREIEGLQPIVLEGRPAPRKPRIQVAVLWAKDDKRRAFEASTFAALDARNKRDDAVAWGISVAARWIEDELNGTHDSNAAMSFDQFKTLRRLNIDLTVVNTGVHWTLKDLNAMGERGARENAAWFIDMFEDTRVGLAGWRSAALAIVVVPGMTWTPFGSGFAWGGTQSNSWRRADMPRIVALGERHYSTFVSRNAAWVKWLWLSPPWWAAYQSRWERAAGLVAHELVAHALTDHFGAASHPDDDSIANPSMVDSFPAVGLNQESRRRMLADPRWWL